MLIRLRPLFSIEDISFRAKFSLFAGRFDFLLSFEENWLSLSECSQVHTVRLLLVKEHVVSGFSTSSAVILISRTVMAEEIRKFPKIPNWKHCFLKTRTKRKKNSHKSLGVTQQAISKRLKTMGLIQKKENWTVFLSSQLHFNTLASPANPRVQ